MSGDATSSSERRMDCGRVMREEILEGYLVGRLSEDDRDAFEEHYFECARCFRDLQVLRAVRGELQRAGSGLDARTTRSFFGWTAAAGDGSCRRPLGFRRAVDASAAAIGAGRKHRNPAASPGTAP